MKHIYHLGFLLCVFTNSFAQINTNLTPTDSIIEVVIAADRPISAASSSYLNNLDFSSRPKNSAQDLLRLVPGLFIAQHAGGGKAEQLFIRGFDCDHGTDVATFIDGMPINMPSHGHGQGYEDLHFMISETMEGIQIFKGPYQSSFGNFATAAAVQFKTMDSLPQNSLVLETTFTPLVKNITANRILGMYQIPLKSKKLQSYFAVEGNYNRGYFDSDQKMNRINIFSKSNYRISTFSKLTLSLSSFSSKWNASGQIPEREVIAGRLSRFGSIDQTEGGNTGRTNANIIYSFKKSKQEFTTQLYGSHYRFQLFSNFTFFAEDSIFGDQIEQGDDRFIIGLNSKFTQQHNIGAKKASFQTGVGIRNDAIENSLWKTKLQTRINPKAIAEINELAMNYFVNETLFLTKKIKLDLGTRFDVIHFNVLDLLPSDTIRKNYTGTKTNYLVSPKANLGYRISEKSQLFLNAGYGFHSNDARSSVQDSTGNLLPKSFGSELGSLTHLSRNLTFSVALWMLQLENELVYVGDDGTTENKGSSRRIGIDASMRYRITDAIYSDFDVNYSSNYFTTSFNGKKQESDFNIPLAPGFSSSGGLTLKKGKLNSSVRYRLISDRPANENNTVIANGYFLLDASMNYQFSKLKLSFIIENLLDTAWNEAQFDTETRLQKESKPVSEIHFTPGTPFAVKFSVNYNF